VKNTFGNRIHFTIFGESHGECIGAVLDGVPAGITIDDSYIKSRLDMRRPHGKISTSRVENDEYKIVSGVLNGKTTGTPITLLIPNTNTKSCDYDKFKTLPRPSHADYTAQVKYGGNQDARGGGHFSGRVTAALVLAGAILYPALREKGIVIGSHVCRLMGVCDTSLSATDEQALREQIDALDNNEFPTLSPDIKVEMIKKIEEARENGDSVGGIIECGIAGLPAGLGEPWFDSMESMLSHILFSIPGVKGVEFGAGFGFADMYGSCANDPFTIRDGRVVTLTNNNAGINGGITNGMPTVFRVAVKPTPSIFKEQVTVNLEKMENVTVKIDGRHDPAIVHRARAVVDAAATIAIADFLL
jgi:chorismate synthase